MSITQEELNKIVKETTGYISDTLLRKGAEYAGRNSNNRAHNFQKCTLFNALIEENKENQQALFVPVVSGIITNENVEILEPADLSGFVVTLGQHLLAHERPIILPEEEKKEETSTSHGNKGYSGEKR